MGSTVFIKMHSEVISRKENKGEDDFIYHLHLVSFTFIGELYENYPIRYRPMQHYLSHYHYHRRC